MKYSQENTKRNELEEIVDYRIGILKSNYKAVRYIYNNHYDWPELDPIRHEICLCYIFGFYQAVMTLTNHFLESMLKYALIINHPVESKPDNKNSIITYFIDRYKEGNEKYGNSNLYQTINAAYTQGLITKEEKKQLHIIRKQFRNAYGHADKTKTFGKAETSMQSAQVNEKGIDIKENMMTKIKNMIIGQGIFQVIHAEQNALSYFLYIDKITRKVRSKIFGPIED